MEIGQTNKILKQQGKSPLLILKINNSETIGAEIHLICMCIKICFLSYIELLLGKPMMNVSTSSSSESA